MHKDSKSWGWGSGFFWKFWLKGPWCCQKIQVGTPFSVLLHFCENKFENYIVGVLCNTPSPLLCVSRYGKADAPEFIYSFFFLLQNLFIQMQSIVSDIFKLNSFVSLRLKSSLAFNGTFCYCPLLSVIVNVKEKNTQ